MSKRPKPGGWRWRGRRGALPRRPSGPSWWEEWNRPRNLPNPRQRPLPPDPSRPVRPTRSGCATLLWLVFLLVLAYVIWKAKTQ